VTSRVRALRAGPEGLAWVLLGRLGLLAASTVLMLFLATRLPLDIYGLLVSTIGAQILLSRGVLMGVESGIVRLRTVPSFGPSEAAVFSAGLQSSGSPRRPWAPSRSWGGCSFRSHALWRASQGDSLEEAVANIREAILLCLEFAKTRACPSPLRRRTSWPRESVLA
jgi:uncharacterized membrane protein YeaQ/YmgE (transglycosylase-associated protein family)